MVFTLFFSSHPSAFSQTVQRPSATYGDKSNLPAPALSHAKVRKPIAYHEIIMCLMYFLYSIQRIRRRITLTYPCFSSSWLLWHAHHIFSSVLCQLSSLLDKYITAWATALYYTLLCSVGSERVCCRSWICWWKKDGLLAGLQHFSSVSWFWMVDVYCGCHDNTWKSPTRHSSQWYKHCQNSLLNILLVLHSL